MSTLRVLLVDDQGLFLEGLKHLLAASGYEVIGTAADGFDALAQTRALRPDVVLMDVQLPRCNGLEAARLIMAEMPDTRVVMLATSGEDELLFEAIRSGAFGYLLKQSDARDFLDLLSLLGKGEPPLSRGLLARILKEFGRLGATSEGVLASGEGGTSGLTPRQVGVLTLAAKGLTYREIGAELCISEHAVKYHIRQIQERLRLNNRAELIAYAHRAGLLKGRNSEPDSWLLPEAKEQRGEVMNLGGSGSSGQPLRSVGSVAEVR